MTSTKKTTDAEVRNYPELSDAEREAAEKEGVKAAVAQSAQTNFSTRSATENVDPEGDRWPDRSDIMQFESFLDLDGDAFVDAIALKKENGIAESKVAGLLGLERAGRNRTFHVEAMMKRLGVKDVYEVTNAGPGYTNDTTPMKKFNRS
jgi:hypothetical protein